MSKILILDDEPASVNAIYRALRRQFEAEKYYNVNDALHRLGEEEFGVLLVDQRMPEMSGVEFLQKAQEIQPDAIRVLITGYTDLDDVIAAVNEGHIYNYISKPWEPDDLLRIMNQAMEKYRLVKENQRLTQQLKKRNEQLEMENRILHQTATREYNFSNIIGNSPVMQEIFSILKKVIPLDISILLTGETGTGKELIARAIHYNSPRKDKLFVAENCGAIPDTLLESRLFGHKKGAFTGAVKDQKGLFEIANGGTIFLDEIGDTSLSFQQRLLRVLQEGEITPLGSEKSMKVNVRLIAATNKNLEEEIRAGRFREDLYYRLNVIHIHLPPLRERKEDLPLLVEFLVKKYALKMGKEIPPIDPSFIEALEAMSFPGNIRELENIIQRSLALLDQGQPLKRNILKYHQSSILRTESPGHIDSLTQIIDIHQPLDAIVSRVEKTVISKVLEETHWNISRAARQLGLSRPGLRMKMKRYGIGEKGIKS